MLEKAELFKQADNAIKWIKEYVDKTGSKGVVIGNSGGKDSATVIAMATKALGKENVITIAIPCNSNEQDMEDAKLVANTFAVPMLEIDITKTYKELEQTIDNTLNKLNTTLTNESKINIKPRLRMTTLYSVAQTLDYLVIGTGNLCEKMVGYTTKWGDNASDFNPIANFTAHEVLAIGEYLGVPEKIIKKAPSDGLGSLSDEEKMGVTYKQIEEYIENGITNKEAMTIIERRNKISKHKRMPIPFYQFERKNFLE